MADLGIAFSRPAEVYVVTGTYCSEKTLIAAFIGDQASAEKLVGRLRAAGSGETTYDVEPVQALRW